MHEPFPPDDRILSESEVRRIIRRAALAEAEGALTVAQLKEVAEELGITPSALSTAFSDVLTTPTSSAVRPSEDVTRDTRSNASLRSRLIARIGRGSAFMWTLLGTTWGALTAFLDQLIFPANVVDVPSVLGLIVLTFMISAAARHQGRPWPHFIKQTLPIWLGFMAGWATAFGDVTTDLVFGVGLIAAATLSVGAIAVQRSTNEEQATKAR